MLPIVLVLLVATSAIAAPSVSLSLIRNDGEIPGRDDGRLISRWLTESALGLIDGGVKNIYVLTIEDIVQDLINESDRSSQAQSLVQTIAVLGELATAIPGNACSAAALINEQAIGRVNPNTLQNYLDIIASNIDLIEQLAINPNALRQSNGNRGSCVGGGRNYLHEEAWRIIIDRASPNSIGLLNEEYCATKRLLTANDVRSNNIAAAVTASALPPVVKVIERILQPTALFLKAVVSGEDPRGPAAAVKAALRA